MPAANEEEGTKVMLAIWGQTTYNWDKPQGESRDAR